MCMPAFGSAFDRWMCMCVFTRAGLIDLDLAGEKYVHLCVCLTDPHFANKNVCVGECISMFIKTFHILFKDNAINSNFCWLFVNFVAVYTSVFILHCFLNGSKWFSYCCKKAMQGDLLPNFLPADWNFGIWKLWNVYVWLSDLHLADEIKVSSWKTSYLQ